MKKTANKQEYKALLATLHEARLLAGITQVELAKKLGKTQSFVSKCEKGERRLDVIQLRRICHILGMTLPQLIARFEKRLKKEQSS